MNPAAYCCLPEWIDAGAIRREPFAHLVVPNALPAALYAELDAAWPTLEQVAGPGPLENNRLYKLAAAQVVDNPAIAAPWRAFFAYHTSADFLRRVAAVWAQELDLVHPGFGAAFGRPLAELSALPRRPGKRDNATNRAAELLLDCQFGMNSPVLRSSSVRGPHLDNPAKLFAGLLYFRAPGDDSSGGDLELYRPRAGRRVRRSGSRVAPDCVEVAATVPYAPNTLVMWLNSPFAIHGVSPRSVTRTPRRYVNLLGECYRPGVSFTDAAGVRPRWWQPARYWRR
ncbi:MAG: hypothetical protein ACOY42_00930 [Pseudomonadota bacterium]|jgi:hypothetical protein